MKILIVAPQSIPLPCSGYGGTQRYCQLLAESLIKCGHHVMLAGPKGSRSSLGHILETSLAASKDSSKETLDLYVRDIKHKLDFTPDIIHNHSNANGSHALKTHFPNTPLVTTLHGGSGDIIPSVGHVMFVSNTQQRHYQTPKSDVVYNPIEIETAIYQEAKMDYLIFMGRLDWVEKGIYDAVSIAKKTKHRLFLCGPGMNWKLKLRMNDSIIHIGEVATSLKNALLANAKALIYPSKLPESFGRVPCEAAACGTPSIVSNCGALPEVVKHNETGFVCNSVQEMVDAVSHVQQIKPVDCRNWVLHHFHPDKIASECLNIYKGLLTLAPFMVSALTPLSPLWGYS